MDQPDTRAYTEASAVRSDILVAEDLRMFYGRRPALRGLSFSLRAGRVLGLLGPNGAGKTTAIRILTTILQPSSGHFFVDGIGSDRPNEIRRRIGVLPENLGFPRSITAFDYLVWFGRLYGFGAAEARARARELLHVVGLEERGASAISGYSRGMRQRLGIARALVNEPVVVFLDEPTLGLDPRGQQELLELIRRIARDQHIAVVLCSHALSEIEVVCNDVVVLSSGRVVAAGPVSVVIEGAGRSPAGAVALRLQVPPSAVERARRVLEQLPEVAAVAATGEETGWLRVATDRSSTGGQRDDRINNRILDALIRGDIPILGFGVEGGRLQDVFLHLTEQVEQ